MTIKILVVPADVTIPLSVEDSSGRLDDYQARVGGMCEVVNLDMLGDHDLWLNEEGKLKFLPLNLRATRLFHVGNPGAMDVILGDAFVTGPVDDEGENTSVTDGFLSLLRLPDGP